MKPCPAPSTAVPVAMAAISARSCPEVKAVPRPVSTTAPTASSRVGGAQGGGHLLVHGGVEGVAHLGPVEGDDADAGRRLLDLDPARHHGVGVAGVGVGAAAARRRMTVSAAPLTPVEMGQPM